MDEDRGRAGSYPARPRFIYIKRERNMESEIKLGYGAHEFGSGDACPMEAVSLIFGVEWSDKPSCTSPTLAAFVRLTSDWMSTEERQGFWPFLMRLGGTNDGCEMERAWRFADWSVRTITSLAYDEVGLSDQADKLRSLEPIDSVDTADAAIATVEVYPYSVSVVNSMLAAKDAYIHDYYPAEVGWDAACAAIETADEVRIRERVISEIFALLDEMCPPQTITSFQLETLRDSNAVPSSIAQDLFTTLIKEQGVNDG